MQCRRDAGVSKGRQLLQARLPFETSARNRFSKESRPRAQTPQGERFRDIEAFHHASWAIQTLLRKNSPQKVIRESLLVATFAGMERQTAGIV
jgi:hypothetical protein